MAEIIKRIEDKILDAHGKALPQNWVYTDAETTIDLLVAEILTLRHEARCPCCHLGITIELEPCQECHGKGLAICAYETSRIHEKLAREQRDELLDMVKYLRNYARLADLAQDTTAKMDELIAKAEAGGNLK